MPKGHGRGKKFKTGVSGNPDGGRRHNKEKRILKKLLKEEFAMVISLVTQSTRAELIDIVNDPKSQMDKVVMATTLLKSAKVGDCSQLIALAQIVIGKTPEQHVHSVKNPHELMTDEQLRARRLELEALTKPIQIEQLKDVTPKTDRNGTTTDS